MTDEQPNTECLYCGKQVNAGTEFCSTYCEGLFMLEAEYGKWDVPNN